MSHLQIPTPEKLRAATEASTVIITGAGQGIGYAIAETFAKAGANVILADIDENLGKAAARKIGHGAIFVRCDVASWNDQVCLFQEAIKTFSRVDIVICNAGINPELILSGKFDFLAEDEDLCPITKVLDVNLTGSVYGVRLAMNHFKAAGGRVVIIGSAASYVPVPGQELYTASKHAVLGLMRSVSKRKACLENGISISMIAPWFTETQMTRGVSKEAIEGVLTSSAYDVALAVSIVVTLPLQRANGMSIWVQGQIYTEVEDIISECHRKLII